MSKNISDELELHLNQIIENLRANRCAILVGAGFSRNADSGSLSAPTFPTWNELADTFYEKLHATKPEGSQYLNPLVLAEQVEAAYGRPALNQLLVSRIPDTQYSPSIMHRKLLSLPWRDIFTTNYDTLLERACKDITDKRFNIINCKEDLVSSSDAPRIIKLHGTFPSHRPFIITSEDYRRYPKEFAPFINTVQQSLIENTFCLIGFSGDDPNFNQWIGWIRDNLGEENSPPIYLFTHEDYSYSQKKLLDRKKVVVLNVSSLAPEGSPRQKYEGLLDCLLANPPVNQIIWPETYILSHGEQPTLSNSLLTLQKLHKSYPGWLTLPYTMRDRASVLRREVENQLESLVNQPHEEELSFLYEYDWLREKCLRPPFQRELEIYSAILDRYLCSSNEDFHMRLSIQLSLLRDLRESGDFEAWNELCKGVELQRNIMNEDQLNRFVYEKCLFLMFSFDYKGLQLHLQNWNVSEQSPAWALRKAGLLAECSELTQAKELLQSSLVLIRKQLQMDGQSLFLLSHESALMSLKNYIEQSISMEIDYGQSWSRREDSEFERRQAHKRFATDWNSEDERFQLLLNTANGSNKYNGERFSFDFGRRKYPFTISEDTELLNAYAFLRFREETGHPFRIQNVTSGYKTAISAVERIVPYSINWTVTTIVRTNDTKSVEQIISRAVLSPINASNVNELCQRYLRALRHTLFEIDIIEKQNSFIGFSTEVLPQVLSQFCCKCTLDILDDMLLCLLSIYSSKYCSKYKKIGIWIERLVRAFTKEQRSERMSTFLQFPLFSENDHMYRELLDPLDFIGFYLKTPVSAIQPIIGTETLFKQVGSSSNFKLRSLKRLSILSLNGLLTEQQNNELGILLWKENLIFQEEFSQSVSLILPHPPSVNSKEASRIAFLDDLQKPQSDNKNLINKFSDEMFAKMFNKKDISILLGIFKNEFKQLLSFLNGNNFLSTDRITRSEVFQLAKKLVRLLLNLKEWIPKNSEKEIMKEILVDLRENQMSHLGLEIVCSQKYKEEFDVGNLINLHLFLGSFYQRLSFYDTVNIMIDYKEQNIINVEQIQTFIALMAQQILWLNDNDSLPSALNILSNVIRLAPEIVSLDVENTLLIGLSGLAKESEFTETDAAFMAVPKGELRVASARLAYRMFQNFTDRGIEIPEVLNKWQGIYMNPDEFSEIRNVVD
jgi:hypothetical protein